MGKVIAKGIDPWFRICGVNSGACVAATTFTLLEAIEGCKVELVYEGCNTDFYYEDESRKRKVLRDLRKIKGRRKNVKII